MPHYGNPPRQEPSVLTTRTPYLVVVGDPLPQNLVTTIFTLPFSTYSLSFLQIPTKSSDIFDPNYCILGRETPDYRLYVANLRCMTA